MNVASLTVPHIDLQADKRQVFAVLGVLVICFLLYVYFLSMSVVHVVIRQEMQQDITQLQTEISQLESQYIAAQHAISDEIAALDGYVSAADKIFIAREADRLVLSSNVAE